MQPLRTIMRLVSVFVFVVLVTSPPMCTGYRSRTIVGDGLIQGAGQEPSAIHLTQIEGHQSGISKGGDSLRIKRSDGASSDSPTAPASDNNKGSTPGGSETSHKVKESSSGETENTTSDSTVVNEGDNNRKNGAETLPPQPQIPCPESCSCGPILSQMANNRLSGVDCSALRLRKLPQSTPAEVQLLKLGGNRISPMQLGDLKSFPKLVELHLEGNVIYSLERWVPLCDKLRYLVLDGNRVAYLDNRTLSGVSQLLTLGLARNQIEQIHRDAFLWVRQLEHLQLAGNRLAEVDVRWFKYLHHLKYLDLAENYIHTLLDGDFRYLDNLEVLDMSSNHLRMIHHKVFSGLENLKTLYLQSNSLHVLPTSSIQVFKSCDLIDLSDNHFIVLDSNNGILNTNVTHLKLNSNKQLQFVDALSFVNLPHLTRLEITNSPNLQYIDRRAFSACQKMSSLYISHNALSTFEKEIPASLPQLRVIDLSRNPLYCDCSLLWGNNDGFLRSRNLTIVNATETVCHQPNGFNGTAINDPKLGGRIQELCPPRILPLFGSQYNVSLGDPFSISCKASGYPTPTIKWYLPENHKRKLDKTTSTGSSGPQVKDSIRHSAQMPSDRLEIGFVDRGDVGDYTCVAHSSQSQTSKHMHLNVLLSSAYLIISHVTSSSVTLTWGRTHHARNYELRYRSDGSPSANVTYHTQQILSYMRAYTASNLEPSTKYKFCLSVRYNDDHIPINCTIVNTKDSGFALEGLHSSRNYVIGGAISVLVCLIIVICAVGHFSRKYNKKRDREQKMYSDSLSQLYPASVDSISDTTPITYENRIAELFDIEEGSGGEFPTSSSGSCREEMETTSTTQA